MTHGQRTEILKMLPIGEILFLVKPGASKKMGIKISDHGDTMIVLLNGIKTPILYTQLWHKDIEILEKITNKMLE